MRQSSLTDINTDVAINRDISSNYDKVKIVADNIDDVVSVSNALTSGLAEQVAEVLAEPLQSSIVSVADNMTDVIAVANNEVDISTTALNISDVNTVAQYIVDIITVASDIANVVIVADSITDVNTVSDSIADLNTVANNVVDIVSVADNILDVNTTATNMVDVNTVATDILNVNVVSANIGDTIAVGSNIIDLNNVADELVKVVNVSDNMSVVSNVNTNMTSVTAVSSNMTDVVKVANDITDVNTVADNIIDVNTISTNMNEVTYFADVYQGPKPSGPLLRNDGTILQQGDMYFDTGFNEMRVYGDSGWAAAGSSVNGTSRRDTIIATEGQTVLNIVEGYATGYVDLYLNGIKLQDGVDFDATDTVTIIMAQPLVAGDVVDLVVYGVFELADHYPKAEIDTIIAGLTDTLALKADTADLQSAIPTGIITMWSGLVSAVPSGWYLCDGTNGAPDLRSKFVYGASIDAEVADIGGSADAVVVAHNHAISTGGSHNHLDGEGSYSSGRYGKVGSLSNVGGGATSSNSTSGAYTSTHTGHSHTASSAGESGVGKNLPPYMKLAYIMKG